jgi:pimeloyl-ACP methyl ester carboxylesterase
MEHSPSVAESFDFEKQFKNREPLDLFGTPFDVVDIRPEQLKTDVPVLIAPGWSETIDTFKESMMILASKGRRVICLEHPRIGNEMDHVDEDLKKLYPEEELRKALALLEVLEHKGIDKADILAHSEGGINTAIMSALAVERVNSVYFSDVGGLIGEDNYLQLSNRFNAKILGDIKDLLYSDDIARQSRIQGTLARGVEYIFANPIRATKETSAIAQSQTEGIVNFLHEMGVPVAVSCREDDPVFPIDRVKKILEGVSVDKFITMPGGHDDLTFDPLNSMTVIDQTFDELALKKQEAVVD